MEGELIIFRCNKCLDKEFCTAYHDGNLTEMEKCQDLEDQIENSPK